MLDWVEIEDFTVKKGWFVWRMDWIDMFVSFRKDLSSNVFIIRKIYLGIAIIYYFIIVLAVVVVVAVILAVLTNGDWKTNYYSRFDFMNLYWIEWILWISLEKKYSECVNNKIYCCWKSERMYLVLVLLCLVAVLLMLEEVIPRS